MGVLLMLMTFGGLFFAAILLIVAFGKRIGWLKKFVVGGVLIWFVFYAAMLFGFSFSSRKTYLPNNQTKEFCGFYFDCHLHASVSGVRTAKEIGAVKAQGIFYIIRVKISSDARREPLGMSAPETTLIDEGGRLYSRIEAAEKQLLDGADVPFEQLVPAGGAFEKEIVFDVSEPAEDLNLSITDTHGVDRIIELFLVGDEDSIFHKPTLFIIRKNTATKENL